MYLLEHIKHIYTRIVFVSNSPLSAEQQSKLHVDKIIIRGNKSFDFGAWKDAILQEGRDALTEYDSLTLMNDTCFGPIYDMEQVYTKMEKEATDFWRLTAYPDKKHGMPETNGPIPKHIQSYFLCFKKTVVQSPVFYRFWDDVEYEIEVETVIQKYKTLLTFILHKAGFSYLVLFELQPTLQQLDPSLYHPDICLKHNIPLVKVKSFLFFPMPQYITRLIQEKSDYPVSLIYDYFAEIYNPNVSLMIGDRLIPARLGTKSISSKLKIAIHLHVFYLDVFEKYIVCFDNYTIDFDLLITTDTAEKKH